MNGVENSSYFISYYYYAMTILFLQPLQNMKPHSCQVQSLPSIWSYYIDLRFVCRDFLEPTSHRIFDEAIYELAPFPCKYLQSIYGT